MTQETTRLPHSFFMEERNRITVAGVRDVDRFDDETLILFTDSGEITIKGEAIRVGHFSSETGDFSATGTFHSLVYSERLPKSSGFFARVFK